MTAGTLNALAALLRDEDSVISPHVVDNDAEPALGALAAAGPRAAGDPGEYALLVEAIREGYLLHYGRPRIVSGADGDLALLAGDYLYALGLARLAALGDTDAVQELSDLISLCAQLHAQAVAAAAASLWLAAVVAIAAGPPDGHEDAKSRLREAASSGDGVERAASELDARASEAAARAGIGDALARAAEALDLPRLRGG